MGPHMRSWKPCWGRTSGLLCLSCCYQSLTSEVMANECFKCLNAGPSSPQSGRSLSSRPSGSRHRHLNVVCRFQLSIQHDVPVKPICTFSTPAFSTAICHETLDFLKQRHQAGLSHHKPPQGCVLGSCCSHYTTMIAFTDTERSLPGSLQTAQPPPVRL